MRRLKHPFGFLDGDRVVPAEVEDGETAECPADGCDERLHVRGPSINGTVRHFWHPGSGGEGGSGGVHGGGGESPTHKNYKSHAASALLNFFGEFIEESTTKEIFEQRIPMPGTGRYRQADTLVTFETPHWKFGNGVIIEVQHENKGKNTDAVDEDYLKAEYSVFWTDSEDDYEPGGYLFDRDQLEDEAKTVWPHAVPEPSEWEVSDVFGGRPAFRTDFGNKYDLSQYRKAHAVRNLSHRGYVETTYPPAFGRASVERSTRFPCEFYEDCAREWFRDTPWHELFSGYVWETKTTFPAPDNGAKRNGHVDAKLPAKWEAPSEEQRFRDIPWKDLFPGDEYPVKELRRGGECSCVEATFRGVELLSFYRNELVESLDARDIPHPGHPWHVAKRCLKTACLPGEHDWVELTGSETAHWRECRRCGVNDVTWAAVYGDVEGRVTAGSERSEMRGELV